MMVSTLDASILSMSEHPDLQERMQMVWPHIVHRDTGIQPEPIGLHRTGRNGVPYSTQAAASFAGKLNNRGNVSKICMHMLSV